MERNLMSAAVEKISLELIVEASSRIAGFAYRTPAYRCFSEKRISLKLECYQPVRSFKIRGASNKILSISESERRRRGVITASSGNHGLAVAYVARKLGIPATIVVPETVVRDKLEMIRSLGANTILYGRQQDERAKMADEISRSEGQIFVQPFNDLEVIAGQGTCGLEILEDVPDVESIFVPIGGGGLISGIASAVKLKRETMKQQEEQEDGDRKRGEIKVIGVQPEGSPSMYESWKKGELVSIEESKTIADGLSVRRPGEITFEFVKRFVDDIILVNDKEILEATHKLLRREHILAEPSGAAAFAGALKQEKMSKDSETHGTVVAVVSGGNISQDVLRNVLNLEATTTDDATPSQTSAI